MIAHLYNGGVDPGLTDQHAKDHLGVSDAVVHFHDDRLRVVCSPGGRDDMKADLDVMLANYGWQFVRTEDPARQPRPLASIDAEVLAWLRAPLTATAQLDRLQELGAKLAALVARGRRAAEHGIGGIDGTEEM